MKFLAPLVLIFSLAISSCDDEPVKAWWRTPEYTADSSVYFGSFEWFDTIFKNLPASYETVEITSCHDGAFSGFFQASKEKPFLIFSPNELERSCGYYSSYFRYDSVQRDFSEGPMYFNWNVSELEHDRIHELADNIRRLKDERYFVVFFDDTASYRAPELDSTVSHFEGGYISGYAVVVDYTTGKPTCAFKVNAKSSEEVNYETYYADDDVKENPFVQLAPMKGIAVDLWHNLSLAVQEKIFADDSK